MNDSDLRWQLRRLGDEVEPSRDLWPGIAARLEPRGSASARRRSPRWPGFLALAACLCVAVGVARQRPADPAPLLREADAISLEYEAALREYAGAELPEPLAPAVQTLDRSIAELELAMRDDPDARYLLDQLRRTHARRLDLARRAIAG